MKKFLFIQIVLSLMPLVVAGFLWGRLPSRLPIHWDFRGVPNNFAGKAPAIFIFTAMPIFLAVVIYFLTAYNSASAQIAVPTGILVTYAVIFLAAVFIAILVQAVIEAPTLVQHVTITGLAGLFGLLGFLTRRVPRNSLFGIRLKSTLASSEVWSKTNNMVGGWFMIFAAIFFISQFFLPYFAQFILLLLFVILMVAGSLVVARHYYRKEKHGI